MTEADRERCAAVVKRARLQMLRKQPRPRGNERAVLEGFAIFLEEIEDTIRALPLEEPKRGDDDADERPTSE